MKNHSEANDSNYSYEDAADNFRMVKIPKITLKHMKSNIKDLNKHATYLDEKLIAARFDNGKN